MRLIHVGETVLRGARYDPGPDFWLWVEQNGPIWGPARALSIIHRMIRTSRAKRNPPGWIAWALTVPVGRWMGDREYDHIKRRPPYSSGPRPLSSRDLPTFRA